MSDLKSGLTSSVSQPDLAKVIGKIRNVDKKQLPFAASLALNATGQDILDENKELMQQVFDRPTRWTLNAFYLRRSNKRNLQVVIERKSAVGRRFYLEVQNEGGARRQTGIEQLLSQRLAYAGHIQSVLPTRNTKLNRNGNLSPAQMNRILSGVKAQRDGAMNTTVASAKRNRGRRDSFFVPGVDSSLSAGVYARRGKAIKKVLTFSDRVPRYSKRFPMQKHAAGVAKRKFPSHMRSSFRRALASSR